MKIVLNQKQKESIDDIISKLKAKLPKENLNNIQRYLEENTSLYNQLGINLAYENNNQAVLATLIMPFLNIGFNYLLQDVRFGFLIDAIISAVIYQQLKNVVRLAEPSREKAQTFIVLKDFLNSDKPDIVQLEQKLKQENTILKKVIDSQTWDRWLGAVSSGIASGVMRSWSINLPIHVDNFTVNYFINATTRCGALFAGRNLFFAPRKREEDLNELRQFKRDQDITLR